MNRSNVIRLAHWIEMALTLATGLIGLATLWLALQ